MTNDASTSPFNLPQWLKAADLTGMKRGVEKESLRMQADGFLSQAKHPESLGAALTHPHITTDYSEALLELITPPFDHPRKALDFLRELHVVVQQRLPAGETLWPLSMPCMLDCQEENIPLAQYGSSHLGQFKTLYRHGLGVRYGRRMQTIAGVHYNLSFPDSLFQAWQEAADTPAALKQLSLQDYRSERYFGLIRNFIRLTPLVIYLLGASPSVCGCFLIGREHHLKPLVGGTLHLPEATALRMGRLGYQNSAQRQLGIHYNSLSGYLQGMRRAIRTPYPAFTALGLDDNNGNPIQINDHVLQIENEYYSLVRPKQIPQSGESPAIALQNRGVAYVELRAVDLNPYSDIGIDLTTACFLEVAGLYALLQASPDIDAAEQSLIEQNQALVVDEGRRQDLQLHTPTGEVSFAQWATQHLQAMQVLAQQLDAAHGEQIYQQAIQTMLDRVADVSQTFSAQVLAGTVAAGGSWHFGHELAKDYAQKQQAQVLSGASQDYYAQCATKSWQDQQDLEAADVGSFADYLAVYREQYKENQDVEEHV